MNLSTLGKLLAFASSIAPSLGSPPPLPLRVLHAFPSGVWLENLHIRSNGDILVTSLVPNASLYLISNPTSAQPEVSLVHTFDQVGGLLGITETAPDIFVTFGGDFLNYGTGVNGSFSTFELDLRQSSAPVVRLITAIPEASFLNGVENVPNDPATILIADSTLGLIWRLNTVTGKYEIGFQVPEMAVVPGAAFPLGVNGLHIHNGHLYFSNSFAATIYKLKIDDDGYPSHGATVEVVAKVDAPFVDDLTTGPLNKNTVWATSNIGDTLLAVKNGSSGVVDGSPEQLTLAGATSSAFGKTCTDSHILYVTTTGGLGDPINGTLFEGGQIVAIDTRHFSFR